MPVAETTMNRHAQTCPNSGEVSTTERGALAVLRFCETSSVKGVPKIVRAQWVGQRLLWVFAVVLGTVIGTYQVYQMMRIYLKFSTTMSMERTKEPLPFPDVTVCNLNILWTQSETSADPTFTPGGGSSTLTFDQYMAVISDKYTEYSALNPSGANYLAKLNSSAGFLEYFVAHDKMDLQKRMILDCIWDLDYQHPECNDVIRPFFSPRFGPCFTFSLSRHDAKAFTAVLYLNDFAEDSILGFPISASLSYGKGVRVVIHASGTLPDVDRGFNIPPGHETTVRLRSLRREMMNEPYGECTEEEFLRVDEVQDATFDGDGNLLYNSDYFGAMDYGGSSSAPYGDNGDGGGGGSSNDNTRRSSSRQRREASDTRPLARNYTYSTFACENICKQKKVVANCGCLDLDLIALPEQRQRFASCGLLDIHNVSQTIHRLQCSDIAIILADEAESCRCLERCTEDQYELSTYQVPWPHENFQLAFYHRYIRPAKFASKFRLYETVEALIQTNKSDAFVRLRNSDLIRRNFLQLNVILDGRETTRMVDKPAISPEALFGNVGGILNLWIGITFITVIEVIDLVLVLLRGQTERKRPETTKDPRNPRGSHSEVLPLNSTA